MSSVAVAKEIANQPSDLTRVRVWQLPVRVIHWLIFVSVIVLCVTGTYISHPFSVMGLARDHFVMGTVKAVHFYTAIVFDVALGARIGLFFVGNRWARWDQLLPVSRARWRGLVDTVKFYFFSRAGLPETVGVNPLLGVVLMTIFLVEMLIMGTGFALYSAQASVGSPMRIFRFLIPLFGGLQDARWIHHVSMWILIALVIYHITAVVLISITEGNGTIESIFSGYKFVRRSALEDTADDE